jgi:hypothetical protein
MSCTPLIWFQHFHKAGGSSFIKAAREAGRTLYSPNKNGNPVTEEGSYIPIWNWGGFELGDWLQAQASRGIDFIACEWGFPADLISIESIELYKFTIIRHPVERLLSNFYYDVLNGYTHVEDIEEYMALDPDYTKPDYYTRLLTGYSGERATREAVSILLQFDSVAVLENQASFGRVTSLIPRACSYHANATQRQEQRLVEISLNTERKRPALERLAKREIALYNRLASTNSG